MPLCNVNFPGSLVKVTESSFNRGDPYEKMRKLPKIFFSFFFTLNFFLGYFKVADYEKVGFESVRGVIGRATGSQT